MVGLLSRLFKRKERDEEEEKEEIRHKFTDADRVIAAQKKAVAAIKRKRLKMLSERLDHLREQQNEGQLLEQINELESQIYGEQEEEEEQQLEIPNPTDENFEDKVILEILKLINSNKNKKPSIDNCLPQQGELPEFGSYNPNSGSRLDEAQIRALVQKLPPQYRQVIKGLDVQSILRLKELVDCQN